MTEKEPERIWAAQNKYSGATMWWHDSMASGTEYIRADIATSQRDALAAEVEKLREALTVYSDKVSEYAHEDPAISDLAYDWLNEDGGRQARAALEEGKDG